MTAASLLAVLRRHYLPESRPAGGVFAAEIESPCGRRRADAIWMPTTHSGPRELIGHEIKVARSDVLAELADPTKADAWAKYCNRWWLVVLSPALVEGLDVPDHWGILAPPSGRRTRTMTVVRPAPKLQPIDGAQGFRRVAVWLANSQAVRVAEAEREALYARQERDRLQRQLEEARATHGARVDPEAVALQRILRRVEEGKRAGHHYTPVSEDAVVAALLDYVAVSEAATSARYDLDRLIAAAKELAEPMKQTQRDLAKMQATRPVVLPPAVSA